MKISPVILLLLCSTFLVAAEEQDAPKAEPVVVTVSGQPLPITVSSASVTVITREEIENSRAQTLPELLRQTPLLHVSQAGGAGSLTTVTLRGGDPNFTVIMLDGIPLNDPTNILGGSFDISTLSTDGIERIEIVRGPFSSLYGSEAISGVINIISRKGKGTPSLGGQAQVGNFGSYALTGNSSGEFEAFRYNVDASFMEVGEQVERERYSLGTVAAAGVWKPAATADLLWTARHQQTSSERFPENGGGPLYSILRDLKTTESEETILGLQYRHEPSKKWLYTINLDYYDRSELSDAPPVLDAIPPSFRSLPSIHSETDFDRARIQAAINRKWKNWTAIISGSWKRESGENDSLIADFLPSYFTLDRSTASAGAELLFGHGNFHATAGIRIDESEGFPAETSTRFGLTYFFDSKGTRVKSSFGEGFKLPSFFALGDPNIGNPELRSEKSIGWDAGIEQQFLRSKLLLGITYYENHFDNLIDFSPEIFRLVNRDEVLTRGVEVEGRVFFRPQVSAGGHLLFTHSDIKESREPLRDRPRWRGGIDLHWQVLPNTMTNWAVSAVGERFDFQVPVPEIEKAPGYVIASLAVTHDLSDALSFFGRIENLLDRDYEEFIGFPAPGFHFRGGVSFRMGGR